MPARKNLDPAIQVADKLVQVGSLAWVDFKHLLDAFTKADLPLPKLDSEALRGKISVIQATAAVENRLDLTDVIGVAVEFVSTNLPTIAAWVAKHPPLIDALIAGATNLTPEETAGLSAGEILRVARAAFRAMVDDGVFAEAAGFFGELLGLRPATAQQASEPASGIPAAATPTSAAA